MNSIEPNVNIVELFSGIGSQAKALKNLGCNVTTLGTCEWDLHAFIAYDAIHNSTELPNDIAVMKKEELLFFFCFYFFNIFYCTSSKESFRPTT